MDRDGQKSEGGLESGNPGPGGAEEFDQVWDQTVAGGSPHRVEIDPEGREPPPSETSAGAFVLSGADTRPSVADPVPSGEVILPVENIVALPMEKPVIQSETGQDPRADPVLRPGGDANPAQNQANLRTPILPGPSNRSQTADPGTVGNAGSGNELPLSGRTAPNPVQQGDSLLPLGPTDLPKRGAVPARAQPTKSAKGGAAKTAAPGLSRSADSILSTESSKSEVNFLSSDNQSLMGFQKRAGISAALPGTQMRRPSEKSSPQTMPSPIGGRLSADSPLGPAVPVQLGLSRAGRIGTETDSIRAEPTANDRIAAGSSISEGTPVSSTPSGGSSVSLAGLRSTDAASVLEMVSRMADQMAARSQDRLSMTVRFEDGGSIRIRMTSERGEIRTLFQTDLPGLETALRQQWSQFTQEALDRGTRLTSMTFMSADASPEKGDSQSRNSAGPETFPDDGAPSSPKSALGSTDRSSHLNRREPATATRGPGRLRAWV
ncbi:MAG: hypothetical protein DRP71_02450 [Verrucomicrobia bacterium]|nr:MAG: hypothetical protein DRP71_02450 [Verrucomicrobiota bacterium]